MKAIKKEISNEIMKFETKAESGKLTAGDIHLIKHLADILLTVEKVCPIVKQYYKENQISEYSDYENLPEPQQYQKQMQMRNATY